MSCGPVHLVARPRPRGLWAVLTDEGFRLFFPLSAVYAALWPMLWVLAFGFDLPLAQTVPPSLWHGYEMLVGAFGAALIGFVTTAAPEWTDTQPPRGRPLIALAALWGLGRAVGLFGWDGLGALGALADLCWLGALVAWLLWLSWRRRTERLLAFVLWISLLTVCVAAARVSFLLGEIGPAARAVYLVGFAYLGLLGLALARITVPVTNLVLDPTERSSPFRPHPGRLNLAPGLVLVAMAGEVAGLSIAVTGFLVFAAGAAFMDRVGEAFIGREALRAEILLLAGSSALAGVGLMMTGAARLGAPWTELVGLHIALMGGLGLGVYAVFAIAGLLHTGQTLGLSLATRIGASALMASVALRVAPELGIPVPGPPQGAAALLWAAGFLTWLWAYWPALSKPSAAPQEHASPARACVPDRAAE